MDKINQLRFLTQLYLNNSVDENSASRTSIEIPEYVKLLVANKVIEIIDRGDLGLTSFAWLTPKGKHIVEDTICFVDALIYHCQK